MLLSTKKHLKKDGKYKGRKVVSITTKVRMLIANANHPRFKYSDKNDKIPIVLEDCLFKVLYITVQQHAGSG